MQRFDFRLERVLRFQQQLRRQAELIQRQMAFALERARTETQSLEAQLDDAAMQIRPPESAGEAAAFWRGHQQAVAISRRVEASQQQTARHERDLIRANHQLTRISADTEALEQLRDQMWRAHRHERQRELQGMFDENAMRAWQFEARRE